MAIQVLKRLSTNDCVAAVLRETPAKAKTEQVLSAAYDAFLKELRTSCAHKSAGKITDKAFAKYIRNRETATAPKPVQVAEFAQERPIVSYMLEELRDIYTALYEMNMEAADPDYMEQFKEYDPENLPTDRASVISGLRSLVAELLNDLGDRQELESWLEVCGALTSLRMFLIGT